MKKSLSWLFGFVATVALAGTAHAFCPVCTVGVAAGLEGARVLGVSDVITGLWAGGLMLSLAAWTENYMRAHGITNWLLILLNYVVYYGILALIYVLPAGHPTRVFNVTTLWGVDEFLLGVVVGSLVFWLAGKWYERIKANNGGHAWFPFQKVVWPLGALLIVTLVFVLILD